MSKKFTVEGKTVDDLIRSGRNVGRMTEGTLRQIVTRLASAANKRLRRAEQANLDSPAVKGAMDSGGKFTAKGKGLEGLKAEFVRLKTFLQDKTSTIKGWQAEQKQAMAESRRRGIFEDNKPKTKPPVIKTNKNPFTAASPDIYTSEEEPSPTQQPAPTQQTTPTQPTEDTEDTTSGWRYYGDGWTYNEEKRYWEHPLYGKAWLPNEEGDIGGFVDPASGDIVGFNDRKYHDFDAYSDNRRYDTWSETAYIWRMVDDLVKMDSRFTRTFDSDPERSARNRLFIAIDNIWVSNPSLTFEEARDIVAQHLDKIYDNHLEFIEEARNKSISDYFEGNINDLSEW